MCKTVLVTLALLLFGGCDNKTSVSNTETDKAIAGAALTEITLLTDWYAEPEHGGFYLAHKKGYFREVGIDLKIRPVTQGGTLATMIATGQAELGLGTSDNLAVAVSRDIPLVGVLPYFQHDPQGIMFREGSDIKSLKDLDGRDVMFNPAMHYLEVIQRTLDIQFNVLPLDYSIARFISDPNFVQQAFLTSEPYYVMQAGVTPQLIPLWELGLDPYRLVYSNQDFVQDNPELVRAFIEASLRGWRDYMAGETGPAFDYIRENNPQQTDDFMAWCYEQIHHYRLTQGNEDQGEMMGQISLGRLAEQIALLDQLSLLDGPVEPENLMALAVYPTELVLPVATSQDPVPAE